MLGGLISGNMDWIGFITYAISCLVVIFLTLPIHEFAHGFTAVKLGDDTPRWQGRLTLNPFAHIDYMGAAAILVFGFGWAKPVQVNSRNFRNPKVGMAITAFAGPLSNIIMAFIFALLSNLVVLFLSETVISSYVVLFCCFVAKINISLAVFNLLPIPPLDGSKILAIFLPNRIYYTLMRYERYVYFILIALLFTNVLDVPLSLATNGIISGIASVMNLIFPQTAAITTNLLYLI